MVPDYCAIVFREGGNIELHVPDRIDFDNAPEHVEYAKEVMRWIALDCSIDDEDEKH